MDHATHNKIVSFICSIANDCLRDVFVRGKCSEVIVPMFVLRRTDCLLEDTKEAVLAEVKFRNNEADMACSIPTASSRNSWPRISISPTTTPSARTVASSPA